MFANEEENLVEHREKIETMAEIKFLVPLIPSKTLIHSSTSSPFPHKHSKFAKHFKWDRQWWKYAFQIQ